VRPSWHLAGGGSVWVVADAGRAGTGRLTLALDSLESATAGLGADREANRLVLRDPDGNRLTLFDDAG